jgi:hypothetical protein
MGWTCGTHVGVWKCVGLLVENLETRIHLEDVDVGEKECQNGSERTGREFGTDSTGSRWELVNTVVNHRVA